MAVDDEKAEMEIYDMAGWDEQQLQLFQQRILKAGICPPPLPLERQFSRYIM